MDSSTYRNKKEWLQNINALVYDGRFVDAKRLITKGTQEMKWVILKIQAKRILASCGVTVDFSFAKPLVDICGYSKSTFPVYVVFIATQVLNSKQNRKAWSPQYIKGFKLVLQTTSGAM